MSKAKTFHFKKFSINQDLCAMKVGIDSVVLGAWSINTKAEQILDIGTGTGILALMSAQATKATIDAVEIEESAYQQAQENTLQSPYKDRITIHHSAIQDFKPNNKYSLIISNPPYFNNSLKASTEARTTARHTDLLSFEELLDCASRLMHPEGELKLILPHDALNVIRGIGEKFDLFIKEQVSVIGKEGKTPNRILLCFGFRQQDTKTNTLYIRNAGGEYTEEFKSLTQDFYLDSIFR